MAENCAGIARPQLDETAVPCEYYQSSDCVFLSDEVRASWLGLSESDSLTSAFNVLLEEVMRLRKRVEELEAERNSRVYREF